MPEKTSQALLTNVTGTYRLTIAKTAQGKLAFLGAPIAYGDNHPCIMPVKSLDLFVIPIMLKRPQGLFLGAAPLSMSHQLVGGFGLAQVEGRCPPPSVLLIFLSQPSMLPLKF